ncbi:MAG: hypothetical protein L0Z53_05910 [Acidobacteriales bacterium]|nr:hypothetical protein [Terriglobales bacterium]
MATKHIRQALVALLVSVSVPVVAQTQNPNNATVNKVFERFKALAGDWEGKSTKGWTDRIKFTILAEGSAVEERSFDAHPGQTMVSIIHPDGDRLLLTHYCAAKNQPRLKLTSASEDGRRVTFEFLDGTNLPSRDRGHMDKVVFTFPDDDNFTSQWTWYEKGKETWQEVIEHRRVRSVSQRFKQD